VAVEPAKQASPFYRDHKEISFSQRLEDSVSNERLHCPRNSHRFARAVSQTVRGRQAAWLAYAESKMTAARKRDRSHPSRNRDWPDLFGNRAAETQRMERQRRSYNVMTSNRWHEPATQSDINVNKSRHQTQFAGYHRTSVDLTVTQGTIAADGGKRNELYAMLREEVVSHLKQIEVTRETVLAMKRQLKQKNHEMRCSEEALRTLSEEKQGVVDTNEHL